MMDDNWTGWDWFAMTVMMVVMWVFIAGLVVWVVRTFKGTGRRSSSVDHAERTLA